MDTYTKDESQPMTMDMALIKAERKAMPQYLGTTEDQLSRSPVEIRNNATS